MFVNLKKVISGTGVSRIFGLIRDISTTNLMGASIFHDIFVICLKIPNLFRRFFAEGASSWTLPNQILLVTQIKKILTFDL